MRTKLDNKKLEQLKKWKRMESLFAFAGYYLSRYRFIIINFNNCSAFIQNFKKKTAKHQKSTFAEKANCGNC